MSASIALLLAQHSYWLVYVGTIFLGEAAVVSSFVLVSQHLLLFPIVFLLTVLGTCTADFFWYTVGTFAHKRGREVFSSKFKKVPHVFTLIDRLVTRLLNRHLYITLIASKFIFGGRLLTILYLTQKKVPLRTFAVADLIAVVVFIFVLSGVAWLSGKGAAHIFSTHNVIIITLSAIAVSLVLVWIAEKLFTKELSDELS